MRVQLLLSRKHLECAQHTVITWPVAPQLSPLRSFLAVASDSTRSIPPRKIPVAFVACECFLWTNPSVSSCYPFWVLFVWVRQGPTLLPRLASTHDPPGLYLLSVGVTGTYLHTQYFDVHSLQQTAQKHYPPIYRWKNKWRVGSSRPFSIHFQIINCNHCGKPIRDNHSDTVYNQLKVFITVFWDFQGFST